MLFSLLEDEQQIEQNLDLIYRHISFRASKILQNSSKFSVLQKMRQTYSES
jgi:hypothetical protein